MTRERAKELLPIITAWSEGKAIQGRPGDERGKWLDMDDPQFMEDWDYRITPEPFETWAVVKADNHIVASSYIRTDLEEFDDSEDTRIVRLREVEDAQ